MNFEENKVYHLYNRGNNQQQIFFSDENYVFFLKKAEVLLSKHCDFLTYSLMPNHFHFQIYVNKRKIVNELGKEKTLNDQIGILLRSYTRSLQLEREFKGSLFQQKTKAKEVSGYDDMINCNYVKKCGLYIHHNPLKARLVEKVEHWPYSSYACYNGKKSLIKCNTELFYRLADTDDISFLNDNQYLDLNPLL